MNYCPSQDWDRYCDMTDMPEDCPVCGKPNWDEDTEEDICPEAPGFCSVECQAKYEKMCEEEAKAEAEAYEEEYKEWRKGQ